MRLLWVDGRLAWPIVIAIVWITVSAVIVDFVWRIAVIPFTSLAAYAIIADVLAAALVITGYIIFIRRRRTQPPA